MRRQFKVVKDVEGFSAYAVVPTTAAADAFVEHLLAKDDLDADNSPLAESENTTARYHTAYRKPEVSQSWTKKKQDKMLRGVRKRLCKDSALAVPEGSPAVPDSTQPASPSVAATVSDGSPAEAPAQDARETIWAFITVDTGGCTTSYAMPQATATGVSLLHPRHVQATGA